MRIDNKDFSVFDEPTEASISHGGVFGANSLGEQKLDFNIALFDKVSYSGQYPIWKEINEYWAHLPQDKQKAIFNIYIEIRELFDNVFDTNEITEKLYHLVAKLYSYHDLSDIKHWITFHSSIYVPTVIPSTFTEQNESSKTRERTYLKEDYLWLAALSVSLRIMIPIWGEFIFRTKKDSGNYFKEYMAFKLLSLSNVINSEPMNKLLVFVEGAIPNEKSKAGAIFRGLSTTDYPVWILGLVVVRRLTIGPLASTDPNTHLITFIHKFIKQRAQGNDPVSTGMIKDKITEGQGTDGENNLSNLERYKIKQEIPDGDKMIVSFYMEDAIKIAVRVCPDINVGLVYQSLESVQKLMSYNIREEQITIAQWVLARAVKPRGLLHTQKSIVLNGLAVAQAVLWHKGYRDLAALVTAMAAPADDVFYLDGESRSRIPKDMLEQLDNLFPFSRRPAGKQKITKRINAVVESIDSVSEAFSENSWLVTIPDEWVGEVTGRKTNRRYVVKSDMKIKLATLIIAIAQRTF
jgi:hypothetical protein